MEWNELEPGTFWLLYCLSYYWAIQSYFASLQNIFVRQEHKSEAMNPIHAV